MGSGDLNLKKSWHPTKIVNQDKVFQRERAAALEKTKIAELQKERHREREQEELYQQAVNAGLRKENKRLEWIYQNTSGSNSQHSNEQYLLGTYFKVYVYYVSRVITTVIAITSTITIAIQYFKP